ncbi:hypothetical protein CEXT_3281 [Caerostris extrusa]|uniref:Uncharacterized protein n=1 Tax=Caerostris extrusa TaxID=172846 RepID=A0AAV4SC03_CAEEX|nr:hypothetical protein CEXT_3281 [Caerostris extrusa]
MGVVHGRQDSTIARYWKSSHKVHLDLLQRHDLLFFFFLIFFFNRDVLRDYVIWTAETAVSYWYTEKCGVGRVIGCKCRCNDYLIYSGAHCAAVGSRRNDRPFGDK